MIAIPYYETSNFIFSNFSAHTIEFNGVQYQTAEHAYHAQKFEDKGLCTQIQSCSSPLAAWQLSRKLRAHCRKDWDSVKVEILTAIIRAKIAQHPEVEKVLLATGEEEILEINPNDEFWGNGADGNGQNQTGKIWMQLRAELRKP